MNDWWVSEMYRLSMKEEILIAPTFCKNGLLVKGEEFRIQKVKWNNSKVNY